MERQSSFGSQSSAGSAFTSRSATTKLVKDAEKEQGLDNQGQSLLTALFGALYTLAKEKINDTASIAMLAIWVDFLMIFTLILMPEYPWHVNADLWIYKVFYYIQIHLPLANTGYTFYLVIFYLLVAILYASAIICVWVGWCFMNDSFPFLWPIKVARVVVTLFVSMFYIASLNIFLMACACNKHDGHWIHLVFGVDCLSFPHVIHAAFSIASGVVFFLVAFLLVLGDHELEPMSKSLLAAPHSMCELRALLCKTVITIADILLKPLPHVQVVLYTIACGLLFYYHARMVPHYVPWINVLRGGLNMVLAWVALMACILTYTVQWTENEHDHEHPSWDRKEYRDVMTKVMAAGIPVFFCLGGGICWAHLVYAWRSALKFRTLPAGVKPRTIHRFSTEFDVEIASRIGRIWDEEGVLDAAALDLAENVLKAGVAMKPHSVFMHIAYSNFLIEVRHNTQSGWNHLEQAKKLEPNLSYQFSIFTRVQEHKQKAAGGGGSEGSTDLVSYVEFQKNYRSLLVYHKASLVANREFWRLLTRDTIPLERLGHSFKRIDEMEFMAEKTYKLVLDRYPTNAKLLKSYGKFLENVKNDPWGAARYYAEAEKQEELAESAAAEIKVEDEDSLAGLVDEKSALITIDSSGIIQTVNKACCQMLGYKKGDLEGKNVSCIMPAPFSMRHNSYLRNYLNTGKVKILNSAREMVALHKDRYVFPVSVYVSRFSGNGADSVFMGIIKPLESDPEMIKAWLLTTGTMLCADQSFLDYAGWDPNELVGRAFSSLGVDSAELDDMIAQCATYHEDELKAGAVQITTSIKHKYADSVPVHIKFELGGTESQRILVVEMKRLADTAAMAAFDHKGRCLYANTPLASMLGYKLKVMRTKDISQLLPQPYGALHMKWMKDAEHMEAKQTPGSCRNGLTSVLLSSNGTPVFVKSTIMPHNAVAAAQGLSLGALGGGSSSDTTWSLNVERSSQAQLLNERRLQLLVSAEGLITWATPGCPGWLFGYEPAALIGMKLSSLIDVFRDYESDIASGDVAAALAALVSRNTTRPGSSWRVGVGKNLQQQQANGGVSGKAGGVAVSHSLHGEGMTVHRAAKDRIKPAIMTVTVPTEETASEEILAAAAGQEATVCMELWRADMLLGVAEVVEGCSITRVEPSVGLLLGTAHTALFQTNLEQWVNLPAGTQLADLMGTKDAKKGGLRKSSRMMKYGPGKLVTGMHPDRRPVQIQLQATMKDGTHDDRLVLALKVTSPMTGAPHFLSSLIAAEAEGQGGGTLDGSGLASGLATLSSGGALAPGLASGKLSGSGGVDLLGTNTLTHRSHAGEGGLLATIRMVDLDVDETAGSQTFRKHGRSPARLASSPTDRECNQVGQHNMRKHPGAHVGFGAEQDEAEQGASDLDEPKTPHHKDMLLSSDSGGDDEERRQRHKRKGKGQKHLTEEEAEALYEAKGARKAKEWLESGFGGFKKEDDDPDLNLPGAVDGSEGPFQLVHGRGHDDSKSGGSGQAADDIPTAREEKPAAELAPSEQSASIAGDGGLVSDYSRGKRLRKLMRLLSSKAALQVVTGFRFKVVLLAFGILLLHIGSFAAIVGYVGKSSSYLTELSAAGTVLDQMHRTATLSLVLEAAQRGYGFLSADTAIYAEQLQDSLTQYDNLHQGLYLGFSGLRTLDTSELYNLWHNEGLVAANFLDGTDPTSPSTEQVSLFNLGAVFATAARDVHYAALHPDSQQAQGGPLSQNRQWLYLQANGPGVLYQAYLKSLDYMVLRAQGHVGMLRTAVLALLLIEGLLIIVLAVGLVVRLLGSVSMHRQALFSVFLAIPNNFLRTLASKSVSIGEDDGEEEDEEDKAIQKAEEKKRKHKQRAQAEAGDAARATGAKNGGRRASFINIEPSDGAVFVGVNHGSFTGKSKGSVKEFEPQSDRQRLFSGKQLVTSAKSAYQLAWPFLLWGILVIVLYGVSYKQLGDMNDGIIAIKMSQRSLAEASRLTYYGSRIALESDPVKRAALQSVLWEQSKVFDNVYHTALYGGSTLTDSQTDGSKDDSTGSLFRSSYHKHLLFQMQGCLRYDQSGCLPQDSPFYVVSHYGIDPMAQRLSQEAELLSLESAADINPHPTADRCLGAGYPLNECRFACIWSVTWLDLHDGLKQLVDVYIEELTAAYGSQRTLHVVLVIVMILAGGAFLLMMVRPFLKHISKESRRCAELLAQLPPDMDVEGMVAATWSVVKQEQLLAERSGKTFINNSGLGGVLGGLSFASIRSSFTGHIKSPVRPVVRVNRVQDEGGRLFSPRQMVDVDQGYESYRGSPDHTMQAAEHVSPTRFAAGRRGGSVDYGSERGSLDMPGLPAGYGGPGYAQTGRGAPGYKGSVPGSTHLGSRQGSTYEGIGRSGGGSVRMPAGAAGGVGRRNGSMQGYGGPGGSGVIDTLRHRRGGAAKSPSKRAVHPVNDDQY